jgi:hypothetical protein
MDHMLSAVQHDLFDPGTLIGALSLVLYRPISVGDNVQLNTPKGLATGTVELISLGYTILRDADQHQILVPNSVMMSSVVIRLGRETGEAQSPAGQQSQVSSQFVAGKEMFLQAA